MASDALQSNALVAALSSDQLLLIICAAVLPALGIHIASQSGLPSRLRLITLATCIFVATQLTLAAFWSQIPRAVAVAWFALIGIVVLLVIWEGVRSYIRVVCHADSSRERWLLLATGVLFVLGTAAFIAIGIAWGHNDFVYLALMASAFGIWKAVEWFWKRERRRPDGTRNESSPPA